MTFNTGKPVPSTDPRDLYDNAENLDKLVNGADPFYADRLGKLRESWSGMENSFNNAQEGRETAFTLSQADKESRFQAFLVSSGYVSKGDYAAGVVLDERNEYVAVDAATTGTSAGLYRPNASATLPLTLTGTWATDSANLVLLGDAVLRQELASPSGAEKIGYDDGTLANWLQSATTTIGNIEATVSRIWQFTPEQFKEEADGTDDYPSFTRMIAAVNAAKSAVIRLQPGKTYNLDQYFTETNGVSLLRFIRVKGMKIEGNGALIKFKGDYHRAVAADAGLGFWFDEVENLIVENLTVDGQVSLTTREAGLIENPGSGFLIRGGLNHAFINVHAKNMSCDGFQVTVSKLVTPQTVARRVIFINCTSVGNARQGCSIIGAVHTTAINCVFRDTGFAGGAYGYHMPGAGFWIEPNSDKPDVDERTFDTHLINCHIIGNAGHQLGASGSLNNGRHFMDHCRIDNEAKGSEQDAVFLGGSSWHIRGCDFRLDGPLLPHIRIATTNPDGVINIEGGSILSNGSGLYRLAGASRPKWLTVSNVDFVGLHTAKPAGANATFNSTAPAGTYFPQVQDMDTRCRFEGNRFFYPAGFHSGTGVVNCAHLSGLISVDNVFRTAYSGNGANYLKVNYSWLSKVDDYFPNYATGLSAGNSPSSAWYTPARG
ncbi:right-handed parallel beta-helix repeat-containing protein [Stutzerimonas stutzeri]|uniref:right-handed parallel beta-helix repeat-containing protein n=1 Tax=Stutzerimonas stutzeri TaxID=316 RepID=UPI003C2FA34E